MIAAIVVARGPELATLLRSGWSRILRIGARLMLGFLPSAVLGLLLHKAVSSLLKNPAGVASAWRPRWRRGARTT